jgi:hypothetical protein
MSDDAEHGAAEGTEDYTYLTTKEQEYLAEMGEVLAEHEARIERLEEKAEKPKVPRDWIARNRTTASWDGLADWVDWLNAAYSMPDAKRVMDCWPAHPGLVHVLAGMRSAWRAAVLADEQGKEEGNAMASFHDYHLFPFFQRLDDPKLYRCGGGHLEDPVHRATDRALFPEGLVGEADEDEAADASTASAVESAGPEVDPLPTQEGEGDLEDDSEWWRAEG